MEGKGTGGFIKNQELMKQEKILEKNILKFCTNCNVVFIIEAASMIKNVISCHFIYAVNHN